jgi:hypothetical protein
MVVVVVVVVVGGNCDWGPAKAGTASGDFAVPSIISYSTPIANKNRLPAETGSCGNISMARRATGVVLAMKSTYIG